MPLSATMSPSLQTQQGMALCCYELPFSVLSVTATGFVSLVQWEELRLILVTQ